jgi:TatD DNase family protein
MAAKNAWFDTHCHLYDVEGSDAAVERARLAGVEGMVVLGVDVETSRSSLDVAGSDGVWAGVAIHPTEAKGWDDSRADEIEAMLADPKVVAVGETGLDLYWDKTYLDDQVKAFEKHIQLAKKHDKALIIHTRESTDEALDVLESKGPPEHFVFHCWSGDPGQMERALNLGAMVSFAGNVSFKSAQNLRDAAAAVPDDRILIETDSPSLAPVPKRGRPNEPAYVVHVGAAVAAARGVSEDEIAASTTRNARTFFGLE